MTTVGLQFAKLKETGSFQQFLSTSILIDTYILSSSSLPVGEMRREMKFI